MLLNVPIKMNRSHLPLLKALPWAFQDGSRLRRSCGPSMVGPNLPFPAPDSSLCPTQSPGKEAKPYLCCCLCLVFAPPSSPPLLKDFKFILQGVNQWCLLLNTVVALRSAPWCDAFPLSTLPALYCTYPLRGLAPCETVSPVFHLCFPEA